MKGTYVTAKGQVTIPAHLRRQHGIKPGTKICFIERGKEILLQPITKEYIRRICGMFKSKISATQELLEERARDKAREEAKLESVVRGRDQATSKTARLEARDV